MRYNSCTELVTTVGHAAPAGEGRIIRSMAEELRQPGVGHKKPEKPYGEGSSKGDVIAESKHDSFYLAGKKMRAAAALADEKKRVIKASDDESSVIAQAVQVIGDKSQAMRWMGTPVRDLDYSTPVSLLGTRKGRQAVITVLGRLEHGVL